ncbi:MAG: CinA family nicotinamide mononucleotide deamidase-related protein [Desulfobacterales bacterium]
MKPESPGIIAAEILSTGEELRTGAVVDTNSAHIARELETLGIRVQRHLCTGDTLEEIAGVLGEISGRVPIAVVTGGLGPTVDDRTAEAAALAAGVRLRLDPEALSQIEAYLAARGLAPSPANRKQALMPETAVVIPNPVGTAPGFQMKIGGCRFFFLPGVPMEMKVMVADRLIPALSRLVEGGVERVRVGVLSTFGLPESVLNEQVCELEKLFPGVRLGLQVRFPEIDVRLYPEPGRADVDAERIDAAEAWVAARLGHRLLSRQGLGMAAETGRLLAERGATLALAESCTGGLIATMVTDVAGSSAYFLLSAVTYSNAAKMSVIGVSPETIGQFGAVHEQTAGEMAEGVRRVADADYALSTTGIAGPDGGSADKPVGTVCIGLASRNGVDTYRYRFRFEDREMNRMMFAATALNRLRLRLLGVS